MKGARPYGQPVSVPAGQGADLVVDEGTRLTIYVDAPCTLQWRRSLADDLPQLWATLTAAARIWPVDVPEGVHLLTVTAGGGSPVLLRLTYSH